jgi:hypothetical protein
MAKTQTWTMPTWMEPWRGLFQNTGGNSVEDLMNDHDTNGFDNSLRAALIISVSSQIDLLCRSAKRGLLVGVDPSSI